MRNAEVQDQGVDVAADVGPREGAEPTAIAVLVDGKVGDRGCITRQLQLLGGLWRVAERFAKALVVSSDLPAGQSLCLLMQRPQVLGDAPGQNSALAEAADDDPIVGVECEQVHSFRFSRMQILQFLKF